MHNVYYGGNAIPFLVKLKSFAIQNICRNYAIFGVKYNRITERTVKRDSFAVRSVQLLYLLLLNLKCVDYNW